MESFVINVNVPYKRVASIWFSVSYYCCFFKKYNSSDNLCDDNPYADPEYAVSFMVIIKVIIFEGY